MPPSTTSLFSSSRNNSQSSLRLYNIPYQDSMDDVLDAKARTEYERDRQRAHKGHDVRRKLSGMSIRSQTTSPLPSPSLSKRSSTAALGHTNWRNSKIYPDDMDDDDFISFAIDACDDKENSRPTLSASLEDFLTQPRKLRKSVSRSSLSRQASLDTLTSTLANVSLPPQPLLPPISELPPSPLLSPMLPPSDYDPTSDDSEDDLDLDFPYDDDDEFSSPDAWEVDEAEDGTTSLHRPRTTHSRTASSSSSSSAFASSSCW